MGINKAPGTDLGLLCLAGVTRGTGKTSCPSHLGFAFALSLNIFSHLPGFTHRSQHQLPKTVPTHMRAVLRAGLGLVHHQPQEVKTSFLPEREQPAVTVYEVGSRVGENGLQTAGG